MDTEANLICDIERLLAEVDPDVAKRVIEYLSTTYRATLSDAAGASAKATGSFEEGKPTPGDKTDRPSFLRTEHRIEVGEVLLELERQGGTRRSR